MSECFDTEINVIFDTDSHFEFFKLDSSDLFECSMDGLAYGIDVDPSIQEKVIEVKVAFDEQDDFQCSVFENDMEFECDMGEFLASGYDGAYEVTPTAYEQMLPTKHKTLSKNVLVHKTPYYEASNEAGGYTATIL